MMGGGGLQIRDGAEGFSRYMMEGEGFYRYMMERVGVYRYVMGE